MISRNYAVSWLIQFDTEELLPSRRLGACDFLLLFYICNLNPLLGHPQATEQLEHRRCLLALDHYLV